jgi:hypothetical protein
MAGRLSHPNLGTSTPETLPAGNPGGFGAVDHSFTLQAVMDLQRSTGAISAQLIALVEQAEKAEKRYADLAEKAERRHAELAEKAEKRHAELAEKAEKRHSEQAGRSDSRHGELQDRIDIKLDGLGESVRCVENKISVATKVTYVLFAIAVVVIGVIWTATQDMVKEIVKSGVSSTISSSAKSEPKDSPSSTTIAAAPKKPAPAPGSAPKTAQ